MMVDIESLDITPSTVICAVGAVVFDDTGNIIIARRAWWCNWQSQIAAGRTVSEATLRWWLEQGDAARRQLLRRGHELAQVLFELRSFWITNRTERIWANGQDFDIAALAHAYRHQNPAQMGDSTPWRYNQARDMRIFADLCPGVRDTIKPAEVEHDALSDAEFQARYVMECLRRLRGGFVQTHQHYKGGIYELLHDDVLHENTEEQLTVYRNSIGEVWARPRGQFYGDVDVKGDKRLRFIPLGDPEKSSS